MNLSFVKKENNLIEYANTVFKHIFIVSLLSYALFWSIDTIYPHTISYYFNPNDILWIMGISGLFLVFASRYYIKKLEPLLLFSGKKMAFLYIIFVIIIGFNLLYYRITEFYFVYLAYLIVFLVLEYFIFSNNNKDNV